MTYSLHHYGSCNVWQSGNRASCTCSKALSWKIRKEPEEQFPWRIWRLTNDGAYEPLMRCSSFAGAVSLVDQLEQLRMSTYLKDIDA